MVESSLAKAMVRVRFPSSAPKKIKGPSPLFYFLNYKVLKIQMLGGWYEQFIILFFYVVDHNYNYG